MLLVLVALLVGVFAQCGTQEEALRDLYTAIGGFKWTQENNWLSVDPYCDWTGVECRDGTTFVTSLSLPSFGLIGQLPDALGCFPFLQYLDLSNNDLSSTIPTTLGNMYNLKSVNLDSAGLIGTIPVALCKCEYLQIISMADNQLTGAIPSCVDQITYLAEWHTERNLLSGAVPPAFDNLDYFQLLMVQCNPDLECTPLTSDIMYSCGTDYPECDTIDPPLSECEECTDLGDAWCLRLYSDSECVPRGSLTPSDCNAVVTEQTDCDITLPTDCSECLLFEDTIWCTLPADDNDTCMPLSQAEACVAAGGIANVVCSPLPCCSLCLTWDGYAWCGTEGNGSCRLVSDISTGECDYVVTTASDCDVDTDTCHGCTSLDSVWCLLDGEGDVCISGSDTRHCVERVYSGSECTPPPDTSCQECAALDDYVFCVDVFAPPGRCMPNYIDMDCNNIIYSGDECLIDTNVDTCGQCLAFDNTVWCVLPDGDSCYSDASMCRYAGGVPHIDCILEGDCPRWLQGRVTFEGIGEPSISVEVPGETEAFTDEDGYYTVPLLLPHDEQTHVSYTFPDIVGGEPDYFPQTAFVDLTPCGVTTVNIDLEPFTCGDDSRLLQGVVTDAVTGEGISGVDVILDTQVLATTNQNGFYQVAGLPTGALFEFLFSPPSTYLPDSDHTMLGLCGITQLDMVLTPTCATPVLEGRVTFEGIGVDGCFVDVPGETGTYSDENGYYSMPLSVPHPGETPVYFDPGHFVGGEPEISDQIVQVVIAECSTTVVNVALEPFSCGDDPRVLQGVVSDDVNGVGVAGVEVVAFGSVLAVTDQDGFYQVPGLPFGLGFEVLFSTPSLYGDVTIDVFMNLCGTTVYNVSLVRECEEPVLQGVVTDEVTAQGIPSVTVWVQGVAATSTDQDGTYELSGLSYGTPYTVRFSPSSEHEPASAFSVYVDECGVTRLDMTLTPICDDPVLEGRVTFEGVGLGDTSVDVPGESGTTTDQNGYYSMPLLQSHPGLTPVTFTPLDPVGGEPVVVGETVQVSIAKCGATVVNMELEPFSCGNDPRLLQGVVTDALTGAPISGVAVLFGTSVLATTDQSGFYQVTGLPYGFPVTLRFSPPSLYISQDIGVSLGLCGVTQLNVSMDTECVDPVLQGRVTFEGVGWPDVSVIVNAEFIVYTDQNGYYSLPLSQSHPGLTPVYFTPPNPFGGDPILAEQTVHVSIAECGTTELDVQLEREACEPRVLQGVVSDALTGQPIFGVSVLLNGQHRATTNQNGFYQISDPNPLVPNSLEFNPPSPYMSTTLDVPVESCGITQVDVVLSADCPAPVLQGVVTDALTGDGVPSVTVWVQGVAVTTTDQDGSYRLNGLVSGIPYTVMFNPPSAYENAESPAIYMNECGVTRLDMVLTRDCDDRVLEGRVTFQEVGWPDVLVEVTNEAPVYTDSNGYYSMPILHVVDFTSITYTPMNPLGGEPVVMVTTLFFVLLNDCGVTVIDVELEPFSCGDDPQVLQGVVSDALTGQGVAGVSVLLNGFQATTTNQIGHYQITTGIPSTVPITIGFQPPSPYVATEITDVFVDICGITQLDVSLARTTVGDCTCEGYQFELYDETTESAECQYIAEVLCVYGPQLDGRYQVDLQISNLSNTDPDCWLQHLTVVGEHDVFSIDGTNPACTDLNPIDGTNPDSLLLQRINTPEHQFGFKLQSVLETSPGCISSFSNTPETDTVSFYSTSRDETIVVIMKSDTYEFTSFFTLGCETLE
ncbi:hypothetical protein KIPB_000047 [Kipferlia bialata]|uniref:Carboxypeptidase regulatory-like domain-containing protein n=1 Tax=Kipferlia bialata TaxID=797122 RepID=A0A9K3CLY7_9EUKA|nr:hypothetical protein KIPB_000047 [Kipferlia bialata]|eukprot:g47.t1